MAQRIAVTGVKPRRQGPGRFRPSVLAGNMSLRPDDLRRALGVERTGRWLLVGGVVPMWLGTGLADWYLHRRTHIEDTAGPRESAVHWLMFAETGVPLMLALFCEVNATVLAAAYGGVGLHSATALWDQTYAEPRRQVSPVEQHMHSVLEMAPVTAAFLLTALHWDQASALLRRERASFGLHLKRRDPLSMRVRAGLLTAVTLAGVLPYAEELWRCWRSRPTLRVLPEPAVPETRTLRHRDSADA
jgi:hypothetical protein